MVKTRTGYLPNKPDKVNQDSYMALRNYGHVHNLWFFGVFDGHGINGHFASDYVKRTLPCTLSHWQSRQSGAYRLDDLERHI